MAELPALAPFNIARLGWRFVDRSTMTPRVAGLVTGRWMRVASKWLRTQALEPREILCGLDSGKNDRDHTKYRLALERRPGLSWDDFQLSGKALENEMQLHPGKPSYFLGVRDQDKWLGALTLSNVEVEQETPRRIDVSALLFLGVPRAEGLSMPRTWRAVYRYLLANDLELADGRFLRVMQYDFYSSPAVRARHSEQPEIEEFIGMMRDEFEVLGDATNRTAAIRFRRRAR